MSKAFVKEDSEPEEEEGEEQGTPLPSGKNYITPHGIARMREELKRILDEERPVVVRTVSWAASNGDRSENGDYLYGKKKLRELDRRIRFLTKRLEIAEVVNPLEQKGDTVLFGATVVVADEEGKKRTYSIVGVDETDIGRGRVSWISPIGKALLQAEKGEVVTLRTPRGEEDLEIVDVRYEELP
ncbi:MAG: transcription elongation factor GreB [Bacteriovoracia bacterium]